MRKKIILPRTFVKPSFRYLIEKKRDGGEFSEDEIRFLIDSILDEEMPMEQLSALAMAIFFKEMSAQETAIFAEEMMLSGEMVDFSEISSPKIERYSTGGVGDKTAIILPALGAAAGIAMPYMNGPDEDFLISTLDKISSIPNFNPCLSLKEFKQQLNTHLGAYAVQHQDIAPVENILYKLRYKTGTIPSIPMITSSVLARKLSSGAESIVVDVKWGKGSFIKDLETAKLLARSISRVGRSMNRRCVCLVTDMNQPIGNTIGTALEIKEVLKVFRGEDPEDLNEIVLKMGMEVVRLGGVAGSTLSAKQTVQRLLKDGSALKKFKEIVAAQGGDASYIDDPDKFPVAKHVRKLPSPKRGYVHTIDTGMVAKGVRILAEQKDGKLDPAVGVSEIKKVGAQMKQGEPLMMIHYNEESKMEAALEHFKQGYRLAPKRPVSPELVVERVA